MERIRTTPKPQVAAPPKVRTTSVGISSSVSVFVPGTKPVQTQASTVQQASVQQPPAVQNVEVVPSAFCEELTRIKRSNRARFAGEIGRAKTALSKVRALESPHSVENAVDKVIEHIEAASRIDEKRRLRSELVTLIGTDWSELDRLLIDVYMTVTVVPDPLLGSVTVAQCRHRLHKGGSPREVSGYIFLTGSDRKIEVVRLKGKRPSMPEPLRRISSSEPVDPPKARITYRDGDQFGAGPLLELPDDRYAFMGEIEGRPEKLMGAGQVAYMKVVDGCRVYYPYAVDRKRCSDVPLVGSFEKGFKDPSKLKCDYISIKTPCLTVAVEIRGKKLAFLTGLTEHGVLRLVEVDWKDDLVEGELVEITHGHEPTNQMVVSAQISQILDVISPPEQETLVAGA